MTAGQSGRITALTEAKPIKTYTVPTYKHKNDHEHNNTSWEQIRISEQETEGQ